MIDPSGPGTVLDELEGPRGEAAAPWAGRPLLGLHRVLELRSDPSRRGALRLARPGSPRPGACAAATALPVGTNGADGLAMVLSLHLLPDLDAAFDELRRVLAPGATLVIVVPSLSIRTLPELRLAGVLRPVRTGAWPHRAALDRMGWLLHAADFAVLGDDRVPWVLPLPDTAAAHRAVSVLPAAGIWPPDLPAAVRANLAAQLAARAGPDRILPVPLRRLVARR